MANSTTHIMPYPILNARYSLALSFRVAAGTPTDPTTPDTEFSSDGGATFTDCAEEITTGGANGMGYLTLSGAETNNRLLLVAAKSANCVTTPVILHPRALASVGTGTLSAGSSGGGTLGTLLAYDVTGCFIMTTGGTGGGGTGGANNQARRILTYNTTTGAFTVSTWETTPDNTTTYSVLLPEGVTLGMLRALNPTTAGRTLDVSATGEAGVDWANVGSPTTTLSLTNTTVKTVSDLAVAGAFVTTADHYERPTSGSNVYTVEVRTFSTTGAAVNADSTPTVSPVGATSGDLSANLGAGSNPATGVYRYAYTVTNSATLEQIRFDLSATISAATFTLSAYVLVAPQQTGDSFARIGAAGAGLTAVGDTAGTTTLLSRLTSARAGYLDNLNVGGPVASQADAQAINQSASKHLTIVTVLQYERPESGTTTYTVEVRTFTALTGAAVNADSTPTVTATGQTTGSLAANLGAGSNPATGVYRYTYSVTSSATIEPIRFDVSATISSTTFTLSCYTQVVDMVSATWTTTDASHLTSIFNKLPTANIADETAILAAIATVQADTDDIQTRIPASLVAGRIDSSMGAIASGVDFSATMKTSLNSSTPTVPTAAAIVAAWQAATLSDGHNYGEAMEFICSMVGGGNSTGALESGTQTYVVRNLADTSDLVSIPNDGLGNRNDVNWT